MKTDMYYFGTNLKNLGHYFWELAGKEFSGTTMFFSQIPFDPEDMPYRKRGEVIKNGDTGYYQEGEYSIYAIEGSCMDKRPASKSVFFVRELISKEELKERILAIPIAQQIIGRMPFEVNW